MNLFYGFWQLIEILIQIQSVLRNATSPPLPAGLYTWTCVVLVILDLSLDFSSIVTLAAKSHSPPTKPSTSPGCAGLTERQAEVVEKHGVMKIHDASVSDVIEPLSSPLLPPPPSPAAPTCKVEAELDTQGVEKEMEEKVEDRDGDEQPRMKPFWLVDDELPPMMWDASWTLFRFVVVHTAIFSKSMNGSDHDPNTDSHSSDGRFWILLRCGCSSPAYHHASPPSSALSSHSFYSIVLGWAGELLLCLRTQSKSFSVDLDKSLHDENIYTLCTLDFKEHTVY